MAPIPRSLLRKMQAFLQLLLISLTLTLKNHKHYHQLLPEASVSVIVILPVSCKIPTIFFGFQITQMWGAFKLSLARLNEGDPTQIVKANSIASFHLRIKIHVFVKKYEVELKYAWQLKLTYKLTMNIFDRNYVSLRLDDLQMFYACVNV